MQRTGCRLNLGRVRTPIFRAAALLLGFGGLLTPLAAQSILVVEHNKKPTPVVSARDSRPFVEENGKLVAANGERFALPKVAEFLPVFIAVRNVNVRTSSVELVGSGSQINNQFEFRSTFESAYPLDDVFLVLELVFEDKSKSLFLREIGHLERDRPRSLDLAVRTGYPLGRGHYVLHLFSRGREVLHSQQPFAMREAALDRIVAKRSKDRPDGPPQPFIGPPPEYPAKLLKAKINGQVVLKLRVRTTGAVLDPTIVEASDPAFGEAALESLRQWRFLPRIKDGHPIETVVEMPLTFTPPGAPQKS